MVAEIYHYSSYFTMHDSFYYFMILYLFICFLFCFSQISCIYFLSSCLIHIHMHVCICICILIFIFIPRILYLFLSSFLIERWRKNGTPTAPHSTVVCPRCRPALPPTVAPRPLHLPPTAPHTQPCDCGGLHFMHYVSQFILFHK